MMVAALAYMYTLYTNNHTHGSISVEQAILDGWNKIINQPSIQFRKIVVGINCNVDLVVSGTALLRKLHQKSSNGDKDPADTITTSEELEAAFAHFFVRGAAAERFISNDKVFNQALIVIENVLKHQTESSIGGNAALMAEKLASSYMKAKILLVGPIGPRLKALLHPHVITQNSTKISKDELHIAMEYKQGEIWGDNVAPTSNRFIVSHDVFSGSSISIDIFFNTIATQRPDLVVLSGLHLLEFQEDDLWTEKLKLIKRNLGQLNPHLPVHLELGSMAEKEFVRNLLFRIIPNVDSIGLNEQELAFLSSVGGGPNATAVSGATHVYKAVDVLYWLITTFGRDATEPKRAGNRLQRIHFHCLTYHLMVSVGSDWSNLQAGLAAGVRLAGRQACGLSGDDATGAPGLVELRTADSLVLDKDQGKVYELNPHNPPHMPQSRVGELSSEAEGVRDVVVQGKVYELNPHNPPHMPHYGIGYPGPF